MFKDVSIYRTPATWAPDMLTDDSTMASSEFQPCGPTQAFSMGFEPVRNEDGGAWAEYVGGNLFFRVKSETKQVPPALMKRMVAAKIKAIDQAEGRRVGKAERRELMEEIKRELMPKAFPKQAVTRCYFDRRRNLLMIGTTSSGLRDSIISLAVETFEGLSLSGLHTETMAETAMAGWLLDPETVHDFHLGREVDLLATDESGKAIKYKRHALDTEAIAGHVKDGYMPSRIALGFDFARLILDSDFHFKKIELVNTGDKSRGDDVDAFEADCVLYSEAIGGAFDVILAALGGFLPEKEAA